MGARAPRPPCPADGGVRPSPGRRGAGDARPYEPTVRRSGAATGRVRRAGNAAALGRALHALADPALRSRDDLVGRDDQSARSPRTRRTGRATPRSQRSPRQADRAHQCRQARDRRDHRPPCGERAADAVGAHPCRAGKAQHAASEADRRALGALQSCIARREPCHCPCLTAGFIHNHRKFLENTMTPVVAVIAPGMMGAGVGKRLTDNGIKVLTSLTGRSAETLERASDAGMTHASDEEIAASDFILSILPPRDAVALAQRFVPALTASNAKPIYVDCNAVSPQTTERVALALAPTGSPFVDAGIIGGPPQPGDA